ncbi:MAG: class I SAM-dependent methyltransferase [Halanaerobiales bacterium]|nr:class I SAM-dependent methyltransferase [Halanaerobiales bacterium]
MDIKKLINLSQKPKLFERSEQKFWDDPHISKKMLEIHLDPEFDAASRTHEFIKKSLSWLVDSIFTEQDQKILDLGCGPGFYSKELAKKGYSVTGIDLSKRSIEYAKAQVQKKELNIEYKVQNFLTLDFEKEFDVVSLVYCELGALTNRERDRLLNIVNKALKPGGKFLFDVFTANNRDENDVGRSWDLVQKGFWDAKPYLSLTETFYYSEADTYLNQIIVINEKDEISLYRIFDHFYNKETITKVLDNFGFINHSFYSDLKGKKYDPSSKTLAVVTEKL